MSTRLVLANNQKESQITLQVSDATLKPSYLDAYVTHSLVFGVLVHQQLWLPQTATTPPYFSSAEPCLAEPRRTPHTQHPASSNMYCAHSTAGRVFFLYTTQIGNSQHSALLQRRGIPTLARPMCWASL